MIVFSYSFKQGTVYVRYPESEAEVKELQTLVQQTKRMCNGQAKTHLWIAGEFAVASTTVVVTSVEKQVELASDDLQVLQDEVEARLSK